MIKIENVSVHGFEEAIRGMYDGKALYDMFTGFRYTKTEDYIKKHLEFQKSKPCFDSSYVITNITEEKKAEMKKRLKEEGFGYLV